MKGIFNNKPTKPKYEEYMIWSQFCKLEKLFPLENLDLIKLMNKLLSLALVIAHRKQTLSLIKVSNIRRTNKG